MPLIKWDISGPMFKNSEQDESSYLGIHYTNGVDTRWPGIMTCGPALTTVTATTDPAGTPANTNGFAGPFTASSVVYFYVARGTKSAKVKASDMTIATEASAALAERVTGIYKIREYDGTERLVETMLATAYVVRTPVAPPTSDTVGANGDSDIARVMLVTPDGVIEASGNTIYKNILASGVTMASPSRSTVATFLGETIVPTGLQATNSFIVVGTDRGPLGLYTTFGQLRPLTALVGPDNDNCRAMTFVPYKGTLVPVGKMTRIQDYLSSRRAGPETYHQNESPIQGKSLATAADDDWIYFAFRDPAGSKTYICAAKPSAAAQPVPHAEELLYYCIGVQDEACEALADFNTFGGARTNPVLVGGKGSDFWYMIKGLTKRWIDDTAYRYATTSQVAYMTELTRQWPQKYRVNRVILETANCTSARKVTVALAYVNEYGVTETYTLPGGVITDNGRKVITLNPPIESHRIRPVLTLVTDSATAAPQVVSDLVLDVELI